MCVPRKLNESIAGLVINKYRYLGRYVFPEISYYSNSFCFVDNKVMFFTPVYSQVYSDVGGQRGRDVVMELHYLVAVLQCVQQPEAEGGGNSHVSLDLEHRVDGIKGTAEVYEK